MAEYVWFITGASSGFGKAIGLEALRRGHKVIATARSASALGELKAAGAATMDLDVTANDKVLAAKFSDANAIYGKITHVANAAGYALTGAVEEASAEEVFQQINTNVLGTFNISRAAIPYLRTAAAVRGQPAALITFGSMASWWSGASLTHYCATKWAVSGMTEGLHEELKPFGIDVCVIEPGYTRTEFLDKGGARRIMSEKQLSVYDGTPAHDMDAVLDDAHGKQQGDVTKCATVILDVFTRAGVAGDKEIPMRLPLGSDTLSVIRKKCEDTLKFLEEWGPISSSIGHDE